MYCVSPESIPIHPLGYQQRHHILRRYQERTDVFPTPGLSGDRHGWTDATWNPVTGCTKISPGCKNCYAERLASRLRMMGNRRYRNGFAVTLHLDQVFLIEM
jgi:hypothetical protein